MLYVFTVCILSTYSLYVYSTRCIMYTMYILTVYGMYMVCMYIVCTCMLYRMLCCRFEYTDGYTLFCRGCSTYYDVILTGTGEL